MKIIGFSNKRGDLGEGVVMMYRLLLITFIAFIVLGISSFAYSYEVRVLDTEARIVGRNVISCILDKDFSVVTDDMRFSLLDFCGFKGDLGSYAVRVTVVDSDEEFILQQGDFGIGWSLGLSSIAAENDYVLPGSYTDIYSMYLKGYDDEIHRVYVEVLVDGN
ncbi:MAG: hypothetical protein ACI83O_000459 [Patescibacteria group bacterium]|jgi:hypothetical protein